MKVLFIASGNHGVVTSVVGNQAEALQSDGVEIEWYFLKGKAVIGYLKNILPLRRYLRTHHYDVVHVHYSYSALAASLAGAKPLVVSLMGSDVKAPGAYKFLIRIFAACFSWKAIIVKSKDMYRALGIKRAIVVPNGVNLDRFLPMDQKECQERLRWKEESGKKHILFPANTIDEEKDYPLAEAAVAMLQQRICDLSFVNCGFNRVELHPFVKTPNTETPYWYNAADVVLMTSMWEGSPNVIKEAMACSRPIVATNVGDIAERTKELDGCYVAKTREPDELAGLILKAMQYSSTQGRERIIADGLDSHSVNQRLIEIYGGIDNK